MNRVTFPLIALLATFVVGCAASEEETDNATQAERVGDQPESAPSAAVTVPKWREVKPILATTCGGCHRPTAFSTIAKVKDQRQEMIDRLSSGRMPQDNPSWSQTADGQKVLAYLKSSPDLD